jgi:hypothetical protein
MACLAYGLWLILQMARHAPYYFYPMLGLVGILSVVGLIQDRQNRRQQRQDAQRLATLPCPACGVPFGTEAAHLAYHPPRNLDDEFTCFDTHYRRVVCLNCGRTSEFLEAPDELQLQADEQATSVCREE